MVESGEFGRLEGVQILLDSEGEWCGEGRESGDHFDRGQRHISWSMFSRGLQITHAVVAVSRCDSGCFHQSSCHKLTVTVASCHSCCWNNFHVA